MKPLDRILTAARANPRHIILPEGRDPRVAVLADARLRRSRALHPHMESRMIYACHGHKTDVTTT
ncbi:hypothetical protein [Paracoccus aerius]|uniref:Phosphate acetyltransferase n=1 Tax=Paracoccus aerius TaxID=1915382 RepID=A0ABS1SAN3_9RHOB|nr:hypothetical protein [Paracoccus aerius]MBL3675748.1 hypothetical protein [Paracoccus aerius]